MLEIDLTQACVGDLNTSLRGDIHFPIIYGVGVNIKTGEIFPATFPDRGPESNLRIARNFTGAQNVGIFHINRCLLLFLMYICLIAGFGYLRFGFGHATYWPIQL